MPAFFRVAFCAIVVLLCLRWFFSVQFSLIDIQEEIWEFWLPLTLTVVLGYIWLRPKLRILAQRKEKIKGDLNFFFQFLALLCIGAPAVIFQMYFSTNTGKLVHIERISDIDTAKVARYYDIKEFLVREQRVRKFVNVRKSGRYNKYLNFEAYYVLPIYTSSMRIDDIEPKYWYAVKFHKRISNRANAQVKSDAYDDFVRASDVRIKRYNFAATDHFERIPTSVEKKRFLEAISLQDRYAKPVDYIVLRPMFEPYAGRNGNKMAWGLGSLIGGLCLYLVALSRPKYNVYEHRRLLQMKPMSAGDLDGFFQYFKLRDGYRSTAILLYLFFVYQLGMFLAGFEMPSPTLTELRAAGVLDKASVQRGEWWRLLTCLFIQGSALQLALSFLVCGMVAALFSCYWYPQRIVLGASGAIFGLFGVAVSFLLAKGLSTFAEKNVFIFFCLYAFILVLFAIAGFGMNIMYCFGFGLGLVLGYYFLPVLEERSMDDKVPI